MKTLIKLILQKILGYRNYLYIFAIYVTTTLRRNRKEGDFLHFLSMLPDNSTVLDIGANIGVMSIHLARRMPDSQIFSFEPVQDNILTIRRMLKCYKLNNVKIFEIALGNYNGTVEILLPERNHVKFQGLSHVQGVEGTNEDVGIKYNVPIYSLDHLPELQELSKPLSGIKIDVENYEYNVLEGGRNLISKYKPLIYAELWDNQNRKDCIKLLVETGYSVYVLERGVLVNFDSGKHHTQNFFFKTSPLSQA